MFGLRTGRSVFEKAIRGLVCHDHPPPRRHGLRHTYATLGLRAGVHPKVMSERLGHATVGVTLDLYSHVAPSLDRDAADAVASLIDFEPNSSAGPVDEAGADSI